MANFIIKQYHIHLFLEATTVKPTMPYTTGPTICPYAMAHVEVTGITVKDGSTPSDKPAPKLFEVSPDAYNEQIVEIEVTGTPSDETPKILTPSTPDEISETVSL